MTTLSSTDELLESRQFCSALAKSLGADPLGTAPMYDEFLMVEFPLPWHRDVVQTPGFLQQVAAAVAEAKEAGRRLQVQAFAPDERSREGRRRVMYFRRSLEEETGAAGRERTETGAAGRERAETGAAGRERTETEAARTEAARTEAARTEAARTEAPKSDVAGGADTGDGTTAIGGFESVEYVVPAEDMSDLVRFLLFGEGDGASFEAGRLPRRGVRDLFVCTHGARDACCGKFGAALQLELEALLQRDSRTAPEAPETETRVWRVSHIGGHRFAPTVIDLPSGRYWGALRSSALDALLHRDQNLEGLRPYYRGWTGLRSAQEQVAEAEAWRRVGPEWQRRDKWIWTVSSQAEPELTTVAIQWRDPETGADGRFEVDVAVDRVIELPESCGKDVVQSKQWLVVRFDEA